MLILFGSFIFLSASVVVFFGRSFCQLVPKIILYLSGLYLGFFVALSSLKLDELLENSSRCSGR